jgi:hypothetical membrane protein
MPHPRLSTRALASATLVGLATFPVLVAVLHLIQRGSYDPVSQAVSELALGRAGWLMTLAFTLSGLGMLGFAALIRRTVPGAGVVPALAIGSAGCTFLSAVFQADGNRTSTLHGAVHQIVGLVSFLLLVIAMFVCGNRFRRVPDWRPFAVPSLIWGGATIGAFFLVPVLGNDLFGIAQRIFLAVWLSWPISLAAHARRRALPDEPLRGRERVVEGVATNPGGCPLSSTRAGAGSQSIRWPVASARRLRSRRASLPPRRQVR